MMENKPTPTCPYCGEEMRYAFNGDKVGTHFFICETCLSRSPAVSFDDDPYAAAMQRADRPKGKWARVIDIHQERYWCSECKGVADKQSYFCPNCGADMRKEVKTMSDGKKKYYELLSERYHWCIDCGYIGGEHEGAYCDDCKEYWRRLREAREEVNDE